MTSKTFTHTNTNENKNSEDDPCDDWSKNPLPQPPNDKPKSDT